MPKHANPLAHRRHGAARTHHSLQSTSVHVIKQNYTLMKTGWYMKRYFNAGDVISLYPRAAKYGLLNGQLEAVVVPQMPMSTALSPKHALAPIKKTEERFGRATVGSSMGFKRE